MSFRLVTSSNKILSSITTSSRLRAASIASHLTGPRTLPCRTMASSIPKTMKGVVIEKNGGTEVLQYRTDLPVPQPKEGQILVKNDVVGVNYIDTYFRTGLYAPPSFPYTLGREGEGTVVASGGGDDFGNPVGSRVVWMGEGGYAEYTVAQAAKTVQIPAGLEGKVAAAALLQGLTALTLVREAHAVKEGEWVLVHAAAGGTGLWLCQLLRAIGARTIGTASTEEKTALAKGAGATYVINYSREDVKAKVMELTEGEGVAAVFDGVGQSTFDLSLDLVARKGSMVSFGNASGAVEPIRISRLATKNVRLTRPTLFNYISTRPEFEAYTKELFDFILKDKMDARVHEVYPLSEVARSHDDLEGRKTTGKLLLDPSR